jgi:hypothetical protein
MSKPYLALQLILMVLMLMYAAPTTTKTGGRKLEGESYEYFPMTTLHRLDWYLVECRPSLTVP